MITKQTPKNINDLNDLPVLKSGWFYLWIAAIVFILYGNQFGYLRFLESVNLQLWSSHSAANHPSKLKRIIDIQFDQSGFEKIRKLSTSYPKATFAFIGNYSAQFVDQFSLAKNRAIALNSVFLSASNSNSVTAIADSPAVSFFPSFRPPHWKALVDRKLALQPDNQTSGAYLVWQQANRLYPSFVGQALITNLLNRQQKQLKPLIEISANNNLSVGIHRFPFGLRGKIYPTGMPPKQLSYRVLMENPQADFNGVIVVDDLSVSNALPIVTSLANLLDNRYLSTNWLSQLVELLLIVIALYGIYSIRNFNLRMQLLFILSASILLFLLQSFFVSQLLWLSLHLVFSSSFISWIILIGRNSELKIMQRQNELGNHLLEESLPVFYHTQKIDALLPFLEQSSPDLSLIERVFDIAIEAEAQKNLTLAKRLHLWILSHRKNYSGSKDRIEILDPESSEQTELEQTLVINPSGERQNQPANSLLAIEYFGRYKVEGILGKGAMGVVFQGVDPKINRYVAIKTLQLSDDLDGESLTETKQRFFREAETAGNLSHANIVTIYDVGEQKQNDSQRVLGYIAMDLLTGAPLSEFVSSGKLLPAALVYQLMIQMADALDYAHKQKVIHRDIKPGNIIYDDDLQRGTLTDFGIAFISDHSKTKTGTIMGSPYYMSPEQVIGLKVDGRSDIFSLGVTFYQLLSAQLPFTGESIASVAFHITKSKHESVRHWNKKLPSSAARITNKAMQKDKSKRYQTMNEFKQALINALKRDFKKSPLL